MASLGTVSVSGPAQVTTGVPAAFTASITEKTEAAKLTWEGVDGLDLYSPATGGLTGDQDHNETINLNFQTAGEYKIKAGYSDAAADNSPQYSETILFTVTMPEPEIDDTTLSGEAQTQAANVVYWYRDSFSRDLTVTALSPTSFKLTPVTKKSHVITEGEMTAWIKWLTKRWMGELKQDGNTINLTVRGSGNFYPSAGTRPVLLEVN